MESILQLLVIPLLGVLWRVRGGWLALPGTTLARLAFVVPFGAYAGWVGGSWLLGLSCGVAAFAGMIWPWAQWMDMGRVEENDDVVGMAGRGCVLVLPLAVVLEVFGFDGFWVLVSGPLMALWYWGSWRIGQGTELPEVLTGIWIGGVVWSSLRLM